MTAFAYDIEHSITIPSGDNELDGLLYHPKNAVGFVLFVHGSGSSRFSTRNQFVARHLNDANLATLLFDLLNPNEDHIDNYTREFPFDIGLLASRLVDVTLSCETQPTLSHLNVRYFGGSTGAAAALVAAAALTQLVHAVSRGGRPDLATDSFKHVSIPTLLIVGGEYDVVIKLNQSAMLQMSCIKKIEIVPGATHLFEEHGALEDVSHLAKDWFTTWLIK